MKTSSVAENKRATIKDIALMAGVSIGSVHCALNDKPGVSESTRFKIIDIANQLHYKPNTVAASLKSKSKVIAQVFPSSTAEYRYYFSHIWEGGRDYIRSVRDFNIDVIETPYYNSENNLAEELSILRGNSELDGLVAFGNMNSQAKSELDAIIAEGVSVILVGSDIPQSGRMLSVMPNYRIIGKMLAELIVRQTPKNAEILLCAGDVALSSHYLIVEGFDEYLSEKNLGNPVYKIYTTFNNENDYGKIIRELERHPEIAACMSVYARGSVFMGHAIKNSGRAGSIIAIGSDIFEENVQFLKEGVFTNLLEKNPYQQAYTATRLMVDHLLRGATPAESVLHVGSEIVFQSNLEMYDNGFYRLLL
jgi:LacI family transcriptional regulator